MEKPLSEPYNRLHAWIKEKVKEGIGPKVFLLKDVKIEIEENQLTKFIRAYIYANGGEEIELNSDYTAIRIYVKKELKWIYKNK